jgi:hypothetical protein
MNTVSALDPQVEAALKASYEALREMASYTLDPKIDDLMLDLGERKEFLDEAQHRDLMAMVGLTQRLTIEKLRAQLALKQIEAVYHPDQSP